MPIVEHSIDISAPIDVVFAQVTDPRRAAEWAPGVLEITDVSGPLGPGATWVQKVSMLGRHESIKCRVVRYEPPYFGEIEVTGDQSGRLWTRCEEVAGSTRLTQGAEFGNPAGRLGAVAGVAARSLIKRELHAAMKRQRATLEREAGGADGARTQR
jgi:uncharacterized protein YndB with AHSA1/START domain